MHSFLETFITVYETQSFTKAAKILYLSQPTVTFRIRKLENEFGASLFIRENQKNIRPTAHANLLYKESKKHLDEWYKLLQIMQENINNKRLFQIGITKNIANQLSPLIYKIISPFLDLIQLEIFMYESDKITTLVEDNILNFGIIEKVSLNNKLDSCLIFQDELVLAGDFSKDTFFFKSTWMKNKLVNNEVLQNKKLVKLNTDDLIIEHVRIGLGIGLVSKHFLNKNIPYVELSDMDKENLLAINSIKEEDQLFLKVVEHLKYNLRYEFNNSK